MHLTRGLLFRWLANCHNKQVLCEVFSPLRCRISRLVAVQRLQMLTGRNTEAGRGHVASGGRVLVLDTVPPADLITRTVIQVIIQIIFVKMYFSFIYMKRGFLFLLFIKR